MIKKWEKEIEELCHVYFTAQKRPYTFVQLRYTNGAGDTFTGKGFSKVNWRDKWSVCLGKDIAIKRAVRDIRKQLEQNES